MRVLLQVLGWLFAISAVLRAMAAGYAAWLAQSNDEIGWDLTVEALIVDHVPYFTWTLDWGEAIFPADFYGWGLQLPAIPVFAVTAVIAALLSFAAFRLARNGA